MTVAAVVLAAGASRRLGSPKQNVLLGGETLLQRTVRVALEAGLSPVIVVTRPGVEHAYLAGSTSIITAINKDAEEGIASSIRCGIALAVQQSVTGAVILACDQPALRVEHLRSLIKDRSVVTGSAYAGSTGVPAYFPSEHFPALSQLRGDIGARALLKTARAIPADELKLDIDTEDDLRTARTILEHLQLKIESAG